MSRTGLYAGTVIVIVLAVAGWFYWAPAEPETAGSEQEQQGDDGSAVTRTPVTATTADRGEIVMQIQNATGIAEAQRVLNVTTDVEGKVAEIPVREGQVVQAGDVLVRLDESQLELERQRTEEQLLNAVMNFAVNQLDLPGENSGSQMEADADGQQSAQEFLEGLMSARGYQAIRGAPEIEERLSTLTREDLLEAQAELTSQAISLRQAELDLERTVITAPFGGRLAALEATSGPNARRWPVPSQRVAAGAELMILVDDDPIELRVQVIESYAGLVREGARAEVEFSSFPGETFSGIVRGISPILDSESQSLAVTVTIPNPEGRIKPGMSAQAWLDSEVFQDRIRVPESAVTLRDNQQPVVYVVRDGVAHRVAIVEGLRNARWVEVLEGVEEGDQVITGGHLALADQAPVTVVEGLAEEESVAPGTQSR